MAKANTIAPFPDNIDRDSFGHWLSGFSDGEACFDLNMSGRRLDGLRTPSARFMIELRADDNSTLLSIQSFLECGGFYERPTSRTNTGSLASIFRVQKIAELANFVVPYFDNFPLRSKKQNDYTYWREAVLLAYQVNHRRQDRSFKWLPDEIEHFQHLMNTMRSQRKYQTTAKLPPCF